MSVLFATDAEVVAALVMMIVTAPFEPNAFETSASEANDSPVIVGDPRGQSVAIHSLDVASYGLEEAHKANAVDPQLHRRVAPLIMGAFMMATGLGRAVGIRRARWTSAALEIDVLHHGTLYATAVRSTTYTPTNKCQCRGAGKNGGTPTRDRTLSRVSARNFADRRRYTGNPPTVYSYVSSVYIRDHR